jgi:hypothetical protein
MGKPAAVAATGRLETSSPGRHNVVMKRLAITTAGWLLFWGWSVPAFGWSHQQHILMVRLSAARLIADPATPPALAAFLKANLSADDLTPAALERLAVTDVVGDDPDGVAHGLDRWVTVPDQVRRKPEGQVKLQPYDAIEDVMHNLGAESFNHGDHLYHDDLSGKPDFVRDVPNDPHDPRYRRGGFVPLRAQECYANLVNAIKLGDVPGQLKWAGYLAHYLQDSTQPQHATVDTKSIAYLAGRVPGVPAAASRPANGAIAAGRLPKGMNPHTDMEYTLFASAAEPLGKWRRASWAELQSALAKPTPMANAHPLPAGADGVFQLDLMVLSDSYDALPLVGRAAAEAYRTGTFDPAAFYAHAGPVDGRETTVVQLMADRNAAAVRQVELLYRAAWGQGVDEKH